MGLLLVEDEREPCDNEKGDPSTDDTEVHERVKNDAVEDEREDEHDDDDEDRDSVGSYECFDLAHDVLQFF